MNLNMLKSEDSSKEINNRKKLYMENDYSDEMRIKMRVNQIDEEKNIDFKQKQTIKY